MQRITIFFIVVKALHVSGGFPAHHQELKNCTYSICYIPVSVCTGAQKLYIQHLVYTRCCMYSFWTPDDGRGNRLQHVELWQQ